MLLRPSRACVTVAGMTAPAPTLGVFIQSHAGREPVLRGLQASLEASDVGTDYRVMMHPEGQTVVEHFFGVLHAMRDSDTDLVLRLEDDALVNRHLRHNLTTWPAIHRPDFGAGWAMSPPLSIHDIIFQKRCDNPVRRKRLIPICVAVMFWRRDMESVIEGCKRWFQQRGGNAMDFALSTAVVDSGRLNYLHDPCIAEHRMQVPSTLNHTIKSADTARGIYRPEWRRAEKV